MGNMLEIRWHGRGGQGAKTASLLLAEAAFDTGKFIQGFPEYGPERMGALSLHTTVLVMKDVQFIQTSMNLIL